MRILNRSSVVFSLAALVFSPAGKVLAKSIAGGTNAPACPYSEPALRVHISLVIDGDTVALKDGTRVRLIGIDTPEIGKRGAPDEPFSIQARDELKTLFERYNNQADLVYDTEQTDRYRRTLAHVYVNRNISVQAWLLKSGLAFNLSVPPNLKNQTCYFSYAQKARTSKRGVWGEDYFKPIDAESIPPTAKGYRRVTGDVSSVKNARNGAIWINLRGGKFSAQIAENDAPLFKEVALNTFVGKRLTLQGYLLRKTRRGTQSNQFFMRLRHPDAIHIN